MMHRGRAAHHYLQTQVRSSSPLELVVMLYDGALQATTAAYDAMTRRDIPARRAALSRAMAIIGELQNTLDLKNGGAVAGELDRLYDWMTAELVQATVRQDPAPIDAVRRVLATLRDGWQQIATKAPESAA
jgi:flagellar protein FliS